MLRERTRTKQLGKKGNSKNGVVVNERAPKRREHWREPEVLKSREISPPETDRIEQRETGP